MLVAFKGERGWGGGQVGSQRGGGGGVGRARLSVCKDVKAEYCDSVVTGGGGDQGDANITLDVSAEFCVVSGGGGGGVGDTPLGSRR